MVSQVIEMPQCGSVPPVEVRRLEPVERSRCKAVAESFACPGGAGYGCDDESGDGFNPSRWRAGQGRAEQALFVMVPGRFFGKRATWSGEICSGERMSSGNEAATKMDVHDAHGGFLRGFHLSNRYELGTVNSRNEFDRAHSRAQNGGFM
ncbi:MAG: hypothetical protein PVJ57_03685 [Phycisphaerae bacterium]|jgi:hypothetical protein